jgi:hypothetical protein
MGIVATLCQSSHHILSQYYKFTDTPPFAAFMLPDSESLGVGGQVLLEEQPEAGEVFLGLQFGSILVSEMQRLEREKALLPCHHLAVIAEETSHLQLFIDTAQRDSSVTTLELEMLGEIDRFLVLMHWDAFSQVLPLNRKWRNFHDLCNTLFEGERFRSDTAEIYKDAETLAFSHLRNAFARHWDQSLVDFQLVNREAQQYLWKLREDVLKFEMQKAI